MTDWDKQFDAVWADDDLSDAERIERIDRLAAVWGDNAVALFHRAGARDSAGREEEAEPLYRRALQLGVHLVEAVERCLMPQPDDRWRYARELHAALTTRQTRGSRLWRRLKRVRLATRKVVSFLLESERMSAPWPVRG